MASSMGPLLALEGGDGRGDGYGLDGMSAIFKSVIE